MRARVLIRKVVLSRGTRLKNWRQGTASVVFAQGDGLYTSLFPFLIKWQILILEIC
jgi:hypothetical protein